MNVIIKYIRNNIILFSKENYFRVIIHRAINIVTFTEKSSGNMEGYRTKPNLNFRASLNSVVIKNNR